MNVLLGWSGERSKVVASALHEWLPKVVPGINPWISSEDICKGSKWFPELQDFLEQTRICIVCLTPENIKSQWIYYEMGVIAGKGPEVLICPYLLHIEPRTLHGNPLSQWQCTVADEDDTWKLIKSLNTKALDSKHDVSVLEGNFKSRWPDFQQRIDIISPTDLNVPADLDVSTKLDLSSEARIMVLEVSKDPRGLLRYSRSMNHTAFETNGKNLCPQQSPRTVAKWKAALDELIARNMLEDRGGEVFPITAAGYDLADALQREA